MKALTTADFKARANKVHNGKYAYTKTEYVKAASKLTITCHQHGDFQQVAYSHLRGNGCPQCGLENNRINNTKPRGLYKDTEAFVVRAKLLWGNKFNYELSKYVGTKKPIQVECSEHGAFWTTPNNHLNGSGCPKCRGYGFGDKEVKLQVAEHFPEYKVLSVREGRFVKLRCEKHGVFERNRRNLLVFHQGCDKCIKEEQSSGVENLVANWLTKQRVKIVKGERKLLVGKEIDIWCPEHSVGIEVHGAYWHSEKYKDKGYHADKAVAAKHAGVELLQLWDHEILEKGDICRSLIKARLNMCERWYARQLTVQALTPKDSAKFFNLNHLQGNTNARVTLGLFNGTKCLCAMSFGKARFSSGYDWEIIRFANVLNTVVVGGASRVFQHFIREHKPESIVSYADLRLSQGTLYKKLGFQFVQRSAPNYFWFKGQRRLSRYQTQKHKLVDVLATFDPALSETANMRVNGWARVWDAGNLVYAWTRRKV